MFFWWNRSITIADSKEQVGGGGEEGELLRVWKKCALLVR